MSRLEGDNYDEPRLPGVSEQEQERLEVWRCPECGFVLGSAVEHPDDPAMPVCPETTHPPTACERIEVIPATAQARERGESKRVAEVESIWAARHQRMRESYREVEAERDRFREALVAVGQPDIEGHADTAAKIARRALASGDQGGPDE